MAKLVRYYDRFTDRDGPVSGFLWLGSSGFEDVANDQVLYRRFIFPEGVAFQVTDIIISAGTVVGDPVFRVGTTAADTQIVAPTTITSTPIVCTIKDPIIDVDGLADMRVTADSDDTIANFSITVCGYMITPPDSVPRRQLPS